MIKFFNKGAHRIEIEDLKGYADQEFNLTKNIKQTNSEKVEIKPYLHGYAPFVLSYDSDSNKFKISCEGDYNYSGSFGYLDAFYRYSDEQIYSIEIYDFSESIYIKKEEVDLILNFEKIKDEPSEEIIKDCIVDLRRIKSSSNVDLEKELLEEGILHLEFLKSTFPITTKGRINKIVSSLKKSGQVNPNVSFISAYIQALEKVPIRFERDIARPSYLERSRREIQTVRDYSEEERVRYQQVQKLKGQLRTLKRALEIQKETSPASVYYRNYPIIITRIKTTEKILYTYVRTGDTKDFDQMDDLLKIIGGLGGVMTLAGMVVGGTISVITNILQGIKVIWDCVESETERITEEDERQSVRQIPHLYKGKTTTSKITPTKEIERKALRAVERRIHGSKKRRIVRYLVNLRGDVVTYAYISSCLRGISEEWVREVTQILDGVVLTIDKRPIPHRVYIANISEREFWDRIYRRFS